MIPTHNGHTGVGCDPEAMELLKRGWWAGGGAGTEAGAGAGMWGRATGAGGALSSPSIAPSSSRSEFTAKRRAHQLGAAPSLYVKEIRVVQ